MAAGANDEGSEQAPADWYDDPSSPGRMRYFDGHSWTNHYHEPGKLPAIENWLNTTFSVFGRYWRQAALLAFGFGVVGSTVFWVSVRTVVDELAIVDEELVNVTTGPVLGLMFAILFAFLWQGFGWLALSRYMHRAHFQATPTAGDAMRHALRRLPRYALFTIVLTAAAMLVVSLIGTVSLVAPPLGALLLLAALVVGVWVAVKLAFFVTVIAVAPPETSPINGSADVSTGRFWPVFGRLLLLVVGLWIITTLIAAVLGTSTQFFDAQTLVNTFDVQADEVMVKDLRFADLLPSASALAVAIVINSIISGASNLISTSAFVRLYLDSGGPSEPVEPNEAVTGNLG